EDARRGAQSRVSEARGRLSQSAPVAPQIEAARAGAALATARVRSAEAALTLARLQLDYTRVVAPADGFASKLAVHEGQLIAVSQPIVELVPSTAYLVANFKETQIGKMKPGQPADRKSTRLNSSHQIISYAVFCLKKKKKKFTQRSQKKKKKKIKKIK